MMISSLILADLGVVAIPQGEANWKFHTVFMIIQAEQTCRLDHSAPDDDGTACVPITKQPASDNPFLKNHKIQHEHDITYVDVDKNYGAKATTNAWEPKIKINKQNEFIFSQIWLLSDLFGQYLISIEAGWQPNLYGDNNTRLSLTGL
uniref:Neprosin PEP catalytic domain-containing protein n=1 Tax=Brassica oleracea var. oleracea TaxID=109376 RepID=A0A0D3DM88_BRAOL